MEVEITNFIKETHLEVKVYPVRNDNKSTGDNEIKV